MYKDDDIWPKKEPVKSKVPAAYQHRSYRAKYQREQPTPRPVFNKQEDNKPIDISVGPNERGMAKIIKRGPVPKPPLGK